MRVHVGVTNLRSWPVMLISRLLPYLQRLWQRVRPEHRRTTMEDEIYGNSRRPPPQEPRIRASPRMGPMTSETDRNDNEESSNRQAGPDKRYGFLRRLSRSEQIIAALIGFAGVILAAVLTAVLTHGNPAPIPSSSPTSQSPSPTSTTLPAFQLVQDDTGVISVQVPENWNSIFRNGWHPSSLPPFAAGTDIGPGLNASTNSNSWFNDLTTPGVFVGASRLLPSRYTPETLLQAFTLNNCATSSSEEYITSQWMGTQEMWSCTASPTRWWTIAMWPRDHSYIVYVQIKIVTHLDELIGKRILASLSVKFLPSIRVVQARGTDDRRRAL
jgi:hypothetical protein